MTADVVVTVAWLAVFGGLWLATALRPVRSKHRRQP